MKTLLWFLTCIAFCFLLVLIATPVYAQASVAATPSGIPGLSVKQSLWLTQAMIAFKYLAEFYSSVRAGGGLKRIVMAFWFGEQLPKVVAEDYKQELSTPPFPKT